MDIAWTLQPGVSIDIALFSLLKQILRFRAASLMSPYLHASVKILNQPKVTNTPKG